MTVVRKPKKKSTNVDTTPEWKAMSERIKNHKCLPVAIGAVYKASPERSRLEVGKLPIIQFLTKSSNLLFWIMGKSLRILIL
jgi:hypothetical protein